MIIAEDLNLPKHVVKFQISFKFPLIYFISIDT